jgi:hypothetical protein
MKLPVDFRLLKERYLGEASHKPWIAEKRLDELVPYLQPDAAEVVRSAVASLMAYQDPDYALLYLSRIGRYAGPGKEPCAFLVALASRMDVRMRYADPPSIAQETLADSGEEGTSTSRRASFCLCDLAGMLPPSAADTALDVMFYLRLSQRAIVLRFSPAAGWKRRWTEVWALLRYARTYSRRAKIENAWVERWLHMIDRVRTSQPEALAEMVQTADIVRGSGADYHRDLANWNVIVDRLVKPVCDGATAPVDLAAALRVVLNAASDRPEPAVLEAQIDHLIAVRPLKRQTA